MKLSLLLQCSVLLALLSPAPALAACADLDVILRKAYPAARHTDQGLELDGAPRQVVTPDTVACAPEMSGTGVIMIAVPRLEFEPKEEGLRHGDIEIIAVDAKTKDPLARFTEKEAAFSDAVAFRGVEFDKARYDVKPGLHVFAMKTSYWHDSSAFPFYQTTLWLHAYDGQKITPVLEGLSVETSRGENDQNCTGTFETVALAVKMGKAGTDGFRDLVLKERITTETTKPGASDCKSAKKTRSGKRYVLHYGGPHYGRFDGKGSFKDAAYDDLFSSVLSER